MLKIKEVIKQTSLSKSSIYRLIKNGSFPKQIKLSQHCSAWLESEINDWLLDRVKQSRNKEVK
ncbi:helix-turn-helix transcriptional regulator [Pseudofrancisella aestuarii]|uniref:Helix-turn-helix transcriptional regulator n=1 Tax=Pseudofrancisella aestuarii TaxID=2670347 RepID=A0ABV9TBF2_9GAMM|nr:AlpA family phage regulatory protein [Pseudofrancisella aestuarii]